tara:strand:+ start:118 stop:357 length:240 start_codon:yes stop_codon:yes gene_type:complete
MKLQILLTILLFQLPSLTLIADQESPAQLSIVIENDAAFYTDSDYTGGIFTTYQHKNSSISYTLGLEVYTPIQTLPLLM